MLPVVLHLCLLSCLRCVQSNIVLLTQAFRKKFVIPDFQSFSAHIDELYENAKNMSGGQVSGVHKAETPGLVSTSQSLFN